MFSNRSPCRRRLAGERGVSARYMFTDITHSPASRLLQCSAWGAKSRYQSSTCPRCSPVLMCAVGISNDVSATVHRVGAGLRANAVYQLRICSLAHRVRQQASSYNVWRGAPGVGIKARPDPAAHWARCAQSGFQVMFSNRSPCRRRLAGERGVSATDMFTDIPHSPASRFLQWLAWSVRGRYRSSTCPRCSPVLMCAVGISSDVQQPFTV